MLIDPKPISQGIMLRNWAVAEIDSSRWSRYYRALLSEAVFGKANSESPTLSEQEWAQLEAVVRRTRSPLLNGLLCLPINWFEGKLPTKELAEVAIINLDRFNNVAPSKIFLDLAKAGILPRQEGFDPSKMRGFPILVAQRSEGPYCLVEGYCRCGDILLSKSAYHLPVILGVSEHIKRWVWYQDP